MKCTLDTSAYSLVVRGHAEAARILQAASVIYMPPQVVAELRYGYRLGTKRNENERALLRFLDSSKVRRGSIDALTIDLYVELAILARKAGRALSHNDYWIAAHASQYQSTLVTADTGFDVFAQQKKLKINMLKATKND